jgi:hypothetical protein
MLFPFPFSSPPPLPLSNWSNFTTNCCEAKNTETGRQQKRKKQKKMRTISCPSNSERRTPKATGWTLPTRWPPPCPKLCLPRKRFLLFKQTTWNCYINKSIWLTTQSAPGTVLPPASGVPRSTGHQMQGF